MSEALSSAVSGVSGGMFAKAARAAKVMDLAAFKAQIDYYTKDALRDVYVGEVLGKAITPQAVRARYDAEIRHVDNAFGEVVRAARAVGMTARAYLSTCFVCPYEGDICKERVRELATALLELGVDEVSISDTIGAAAPSDVFDTVGYCLATLPVDRLALHFHDTYGTALANVLAGLELGVSTFDSSAGGLGGCPFAPGATGNLATEDLLYMLERMNIRTGVDLARVAQASRVMADALGRELPSRNLRRLDAQRGSG